MTKQYSSPIARFFALVAISSMLLPVTSAQQQTAPPARQGATQQSSTSPAQQSTTPPAQSGSSNVINIHQLPPPPPPESAKQNGKTISVYSDLVQIDVTVVDKDGNPMKGLKRENFQLSEEGKNQELTAIDYFDAAKETIETAEKGDASEPITIDLKTANDPDKLRPIVREHRMIVLFFDLTSMQPEDLQRCTKAAMDFLEKQMTPADLVGIVSFGTQFIINVDFTNNKEQLKRAVTALANPGKDSMLSGMASSANDTVTEDNQAAFTADDTEFNIFNTDNKLYAVESLCSLLGSIPGKKAVMEFTGGITQTGEENRSAVQAATDAANKNDVSLFQVDARGLMTDVPGGDASTGAASGTSGYSGATILNQVTQRQNSRDTLSTLAQDTGGRMFADVNDFAQVFKQVQDDTTGYYLLSYYSSNLKRDGRYRAVNVKLVNVPGGKITAHRVGYYAPKDFGIFNTEDKEKQLDDAMASEVAVVELPIALDTGEYRMPNGEFFVPVSVKLASSALQAAQKNGKQAAKFDFLYELRDVNSKRVAGTQRETMTVPITANQQAIVYQGGIVVAPGHYKLKFLARDNDSGHMGTFEQDLTLAPPQPNKLELSSITLSSQLAEVPKKTDVHREVYGDNAKLAESPLDVNGQRIVPSVTRVFTSGQTLYVFFQAYAPSKTDPRNLRAGLVFFRNGQRFNDTPVVEPAETDDKDHTASFRISLPLSKLPAGRYTVRSVVVDTDGTQQAVFGSNYFALRQEGTGTATTPAAPAGSTKPGTK
jgi:VWFA-related protein